MFVFCCWLEEMFTLFSFWKYECVKFDVVWTDMSDWAVGGHILLNMSELLQRKVVLFLFDVLRDPNQKDQCKSEYRVLRSFVYTTA